MKKAIITLLFLATTAGSFAQEIVFDRNHFNIVNENGAVRLSSENAHTGYLETVVNRLDDIKLNVSSVVMVQTLIHQALTEVDQGLRSGLAVQQIGQVSGEIIQESNTMIAIARSDPYLLLFAEEFARQVKDRGVRLVSEVSAFVLKEGENVLMDYEKRDALLKKIILELKVIRALCYSMQRSMYWAKLNGVLKTVNPYRNFISQDKRLADEIIRNYQLFKP